MIRDATVPKLSLTLALFLGSAILLSIGLIFLCAAVENAHRLYTSIPLLLGGAGLAAWAGRRWWRARQLSPAVLGSRLLNLASAHEGELTLAQITSALGLPSDFAQPTLAQLQSEGLLFEDRRPSGAVYVFPGLLKAKVARRCVYCGNEYSVRQPLHKCPNCGGTLELSKS